MTQQRGQTNLGWVQKQPNMPKVALEQPQNVTKALQTPIATKSNPKTCI